MLLHVVFELYSFSLSMYPLMMLSLLHVIFSQWIRILSFNGLGKFFILFLIVLNGISFLKIYLDKSLLNLTYLNIY